MSDADPVQVHPDVQNPHQQEEKRRPDVKLQEPGVKLPESKVKKCFGVSKADDTLQQEMDATVKYFSAFEAEKTEITQCDKIYQNGNYTYMYITYELVLKNGQSYPCISTYMVQKKDNGKYYVMTPSEITDDLSKQAATKYADFMNTQAYKDYTTAYDKFIKKNPGYEEKIAAKLK